ncbi:hypothetical protein EZJ19_03530 [Parasulfuritortus cantonensis]|uniref:Uncharacterized protein n=1 Tax=Parasulfuritortus cantonensis TaxID=2528202 RepID=A0A4R1BL52_9PROT|nr:hypothetical protein [Parasulfuritortus cantonensis]TCJ17988.1 hypothetical protein EZJ19_03530 [Parasulfuritortus cantonensis]
MFLEIVDHPAVGLSGQREGALQAGVGGRALGDVAMPNYAGFAVHSRATTLSSRARTLLDLLHLGF